MKISKDTRISVIIKEKKEAIDVIAEINKHFKKLKNPILRKVLAPRVSVAEAARIGKTTSNEFLKRLATIGFEIELETEKTQTISIQKRDTKNLKIVALDVRPTIDSGADPFKEIMQAIKKMEVGETLKVINIFEPLPLVNILQEKGYTTWTDIVDTNEYHTFFTKTAATDSHKEVVESMPISEGSFDEKLLTYGGNIKEIDVRHLEMPEPMVTILKEIETLPEKHVLLVNHKKIPQFLLPELKTRNYQWLSKDIAPGHTLLLVFK